MVGGRKQPRRKIYKQARRDVIQKKPKRATTGKLGEMEIWWGRRAAKKGYYRQGEL
jgi:hypothetical protein